MSARTPFVVVGGFLGAGKTTLLNRWLRNTGGLRLGVLVNDFGALQVDGTLLAQTAAAMAGPATAAAGAHPTVALANGCVCCTIGDDLGRAIDQLLAQPGQLDALIVETSGVADPWRVAQYALADRRLVLECVVVLADAASLAAHEADPRLTDTLRRPLAHADLVLINHADRAGDAELAAAEAWAQAGAPGVPRLRCVHSEVPLAAVLGTGLHQARGGWPTHSPQAADHGNQFSAWSHQPADSFDAEALRAWLRAMPPGVLRLKGWLPCTDGRWAELQWAGRHASMRFAPTGPEGGARLVALGLQGHLPVEILNNSLALCAQNRAPAAAAVDSPNRSPS
jgi:G3E family GTPase